MASSLTYQFRQQQQQQVDDKHDGCIQANLPSPPNSSCGEENTCTTTQSTPNDLQRRDSLQSHFSTLTLQAISNSLPENYTIDHSSIKASLQQALAATVAAKTAADTLPIPITSRRGSHKDASPHQYSPASVAAATGGLTIRHRRPDQRKHRLLSESPQHLKSSTSLPSTGLQHRCVDCGKVYKHSSCLVKHRWEHSEEWELTSKLPLTKHQQVQMLEAAAILVSMDQSQNQIEQDEEVVDILNDDDDVTMTHRFSSVDEEDESIQVDDDDDISIEMDQDLSDQEQHTFPTMIGSTPAMLPSFNVD